MWRMRPLPLLPLLAITTQEQQEEHQQRMAATYARIFPLHELAISWEEVYDRDA